MKVNIEQLISNDAFPCYIGGRKYQAVKNVNKPAVRYLHCWYGTEYIDTQLNSWLGFGGRVRQYPESIRYYLLFSKFPETVMHMSVGRPIIDLIDHPIVKSRHTSNHLVHNVGWDDDIEATAFCVDMAA